MPRMKRQHYLAAEVFGYSYDHYADRVGINVRFGRYMPQDVAILQRAEREGWDDSRLAAALEVNPDHVQRWREAYQEAKDIVDAPTPAEAFRRDVRHSIRNALAQGLDGDEAIERLVVQIGYRAADLGHLLKQEGARLHQYSQALRAEPHGDSSEDGPEP